MIAGILGGDRLEDPLPQRVSLLHGVALVRHAHLGQPAAPRELEGVTNDAVDALEGVDLLLDRHLVVGPRLEPPADAHVQPFGVFAKHRKPHVVRTAALQRTEPLVEQQDRAVVDVEIQLEARAEEDVAGVAIVRDAGVAQARR